MKENVDNITVEINERAIVEVINFDENTSWIRWYLPDFSDNGNIDLPKGGNYQLKERIGNIVTVEYLVK
jgi:hypothetical protein